MDAMKRVLLYSDCDFFAGCENIIAILMNDQRFVQLYEPKFLYRKSVQYIAGIEERLNDLTNVRASGVRAVRRSQLPVVIRDRIFFRILWKIIAFTCWPALVVHNYFALKKAFSNSGCEVLIINNGGYPGALGCLIAARVARSLGFSRVIMIVNNTAQKPCAFVRWFVDFRDRYIFNSIDVVITGSIATRDALKEARDTGDVQFSVIPNGIDPERFNSKRILSRQSKRFDAESFITFTIIGLHEERKGHRVLLSAVSDLREKEPELASRARFIVEGRGDLTAGLIEYATKLDVADVVEFIGHADDISELYEATDVLVLPSLHSEDLPNVISEAMLFGIPTIGSRVAGIPSQIKTGFNGVLVMPGDYAELSEAIRVLIEEPFELNNLSRNCINVFNERFNRDIAVGKYVALIEEGVCCE